MLHSREAKSVSELIHRTKSRGSVCLTLHFVFLQSFSLIEMRFQIPFLKYHLPVTPPHPPHPPPPPKLPPMGPHLPTPNSPSWGPHPTPKLPLMPPHLHVTHGPPYPRPLMRPHPPPPQRHPTPSWALTPTPSSLPNPVSSSFPSSFLPVSAGGMEQSSTDRILSASAGRRDIAGRRPNVFTVLAVSI